MQVLIMRHGDAALQAASDSVRPLTAKGITDSRCMAKWLAGQHVQIDTVLVSPYLRAEQTLTEIRDALSLPAQEEVMPGLTPSGNADSTADYIRFLAEEGRNGVLVVSHLPLVGYLERHCVRRKRHRCLQHRLLPVLNWMMTDAAHCSGTAVPDRLTDYSRRAVSAISISSSNAAVPPHSLGAW